jgi:ribosomal protein L37E
MEIIECGVCGEITNINSSDCDECGYPRHITNYKKLMENKIETV